MIHFNKNPDSVNNILFGLAQLTDGIVRTLSLGLMLTDLPLTVSRSTARRRFAKLKEKTMTPKEAQRQVQKERDAAERDMRNVDQFIDRLNQHPSTLPLWRRLLNFFKKA